MKQKILLILVILSLAAALRAETMSAALTLSYLGKADAGFKEIYGAGGIQPGLRFEAAVWKSLSLYAAYGFFAKKGTTAVLAEESKTTQHFIAAGAAWRQGLSAKLDGSLYAGLLVVRYREEALGETVKGTALGVEAGGGLRYMLSARLFLSPFISYLLADDTIAGTKAKLGGFKAGVGAGLAF